MFPSITRSRACRSWQHASLLAGAALLLLGLSPQTKAQETVGGGTVTSPAVGPAPSFVPPDLQSTPLTLVKNWHFGTDGTITNYADMSANFFYHDNDSCIANGPWAYGALMVAPDVQDAIVAHDLNYVPIDPAGQPIEGKDTASPVRQFTADSLKTFLVPLNGPKTYDVNGVWTVLPQRHEVGCGSFMAQWTLPAGGKLLGQDIIWETKVRYVTPPYFWFALWTVGNQWNKGAEHDLIESYGEDYANDGLYQGCLTYGPNNFDGHLWHSNAVRPDTDLVDYFGSNWWGAAMAQQQVPMPYDATQYHIWTWVYRHDNSYAMYVDGILVQQGAGYPWTVGDTPTGAPVNMNFRFDAGWGSMAVMRQGVNGTAFYPVDQPLAASALAGTYYEFNYSHVYLSQPYPYSNPTVSLPGTVQAVNYENGGSGVAYSQTRAGLIPPTLYRSDNSGADYGTALGWTTPGQWYKYAVNVAAAGTYDFSFQAGSPDGGTFHVEDEAGHNLTGEVSVINPITGTSSGAHDNYQLCTAPRTAALSAGPHVLKWVQDSGSDYDLYSMTVSPTEAPNGPHALPGTVNATDYDLGGLGFAYFQGTSGNITLYRSDNSGADYGTALGWTAATQYYKYTVNVGAGGPFAVSFSAGSPGGGTFHLEDEKGSNLTGSVTVPSTGDYRNFGFVTVPTPVTLTRGTHTLKWVQDSGGYDLQSMTFTSLAAIKSSAAFVTSDTATQGTWKGIYGADGYIINGDSNVPPAYGTVAINSPWSSTWALSTSAVRALQKAASATDRIASAWGGGPPNPDYDFDCNLSDGKTHRVALYGLDWDDNRIEAVQVVDAATGAVLDSRILSSFQNGIYLVWNVKGHVKLHVTSFADPNSATSGIFFDSAPAAPSGLKATAGAAGSKTITVSWTASSGAASYTVSSAASSGGTYTPVGTTTTPSFANTGLTSGTTYFYKVSASSAVGTSSLAGPVSAKAP